MRSLNRHKKIAIASACIGIAGGCWWFAAEQADSGLPSGSVMVIPNWKQFDNGRPYTESAMPPYFWTTGGDLLHGSDNADGRKSVVRYHLTPHKSLEAYSNTGVTIPRGGWLLEPTPDGSGLLYETTYARHPHDPDLHLLTSDGKVDRMLPALWTIDRVWLPDGKNWIISRDDGDFLNGTDGIALRKLNTRSVTKWYPFVLAVNRQSHAIATIVAGSEFMAHGPYRGSVGINSPNVLLLEFDPESPSRILRQWRVPVPDLAIDGSIIISPIADRILWVVNERLSKTSQLFNRILPKSMQIVQGDQAVYVSRLDGSGMRKLFSAPRLQQNSGRNESSLSKLMVAIRWLPDDKRISFIYNNALYIAPATVAK